MTVAKTAENESALDIVKIKDGDYLDEPLRFEFVKSLDAGYVRPIVTTAKDLSARDVKTLQALGSSSEGMTQRQLETALDITSKVSRSTLVRLVALRQVERRQKGKAALFLLTGEGRRILEACGGVVGSDKPEPLDLEQTKARMLREVREGQVKSRTDLFALVAVAGGIRDVMKVAYIQLERDGILTEPVRGGGITLGPNASLEERTR